MLLKHAFVCGVGSTIVVQTFAMQTDQALHTGQRLSQNETKRPNVVMIMTDDQDLHLNSLDYQSAVQKHLKDKGTFYSKHFVTMAQCCPSRVSLWTGMAGHNTNVTDIQPPFGKNSATPNWQNSADKKRQNRRVSEVHTRGTQ
jgi:hypothetical protein